MKNLLKNSIIPFFASRPVSMLAECIVQTGVPIFMLHRFKSEKNPDTGHEPDYLKKCLTHLCEHNYTFISLNQIIASIKNKEPLPKRAIAFTMDDGFLDQASIAAPIFIEYQCPVTIFLISGFLDKELWPWDDQVSFLINHSKQTNISIKLDGVSKNFKIAQLKQRRKSIRDIQNWIKTLSATQLAEHMQQVSLAANIEIPQQAPDNYQPMSWQSARNLEKQGVIFAPHTHSHRILSQMDDDGAKDEITKSWQRVQQELHSPSPVFCYPTGRKQDFTDREISSIQHIGLSGAVSTEPTYVKPKNTQNHYLYRLPRFGFPDSFTDFIQYSSWIERAKTQVLRR